MKKRVISLLLVLVTVIGLIPQFVFTADAAEQMKYKPYANVEYGKTSSVKCGTIRYISQITSSKNFYDSYWGSTWKKQAGSECGTSSISMALSYIGINKTPKNILDDGKGQTVFGKGWGGSTYKGYNYSNLSAAMDKYINGNGKYSPPVIHLSKYTGPDTDHWVVLVGRVDSDTYQVLDPATTKLWNITINGKKATYTLPSGKKVTNDTIVVGGDDVRQWYNKSATGIKAEIITQPKDVKAFAGETAKVTLKASGTGLTYKWYYKDKGASKFSYTSTFTGNSYSVKMDASRSGRQVYCVVTDKDGNTATSNTVTLSLAQAAKITTQPKSVTVANGETAKATVKATGDGLSYQWYYKKTGQSSFSKSSITDATYSVTMNDGRDGVQIYCKVKDQYDNVETTNTVTLSMKKTAKITTQPKNAKVADGKTAKTTVKATGDGLSYQWYVKESGKSSFKKSSIKSDTYSVKMTSKIDGRQVYCKVTDKYGNSVNSKTVTLSAKKTAKITTQPKSATVIVGEKAKTTVKATGDGLKYQWYYKDSGKSSYTKSSVTSATYTLTMSAKNDGRKVYCKVTDEYGNTVKSSTVTLSTNKICKKRFSAYCTIKATAKTNAMSLPCSSGTDSSSKVLEKVSKGKTYTATALILNSQGNHWYQVTTSDGKTAYIPSSKMTFVDDLTKDIKITDPKAPSTLKKGKSFSIEGKITSTYNTITKVEAKVYVGNKASGEKAIPSGEETVNGKSYSLKGSKVDKELQFNKLSAGTYTYAVYAYYSNHYAKTEKTSAENTGKVCLYTKTFTVK